MESCTVLSLSRYSLCFCATFSSKAATSLFFAFAIAHVADSRLFPGTCRAEHIHEEDEIHREMPMMRNSFMTSIPRLPSIIIQHSYEPTHRARHRPRAFAIETVSPRTATLGNVSMAVSSFSRLSSMAGSPIVSGINSKFMIDYIICLILLLKLLSIIESV